MTGESLSKFKDVSDVNEFEILKRAPKDIDIDELALIGEFLALKDPHRLSETFLWHCHWLYWGHALRKTNLSVETDVNLILNELNQRATRRTNFIIIWLSGLALLVSLASLVVSWQANNCRL